MREEQNMHEFRNISIRGRMAYLLCSFKKLLMYYNCTIDDWKIILEKLWKFTSVEYFDDWMYEIAEYLPNSIMEDGLEDVEYISEEEFYFYKQVYYNVADDIKEMIQIIFELGTCEIYGRITNNSSGTLEKLKEGILLLEKNNITLIDIDPFKKYKFYENNGWGLPFDGKELFDLK